MTAFVDASVLVALVAREDDWRVWSIRLDKEPDAVTSPLAVWEAVRAIQRISQTAYAEAERQLHDMLGALQIRIVPIGETDAHAAIRAQAKYGKGEHAAKLNMGDCFAYACATTNGAQLLYKGSDFAQTDLA